MDFPPVIPGQKSTYTRVRKSGATSYDEVIPGSTLVGYVNADHWALAVPLDRSHPWITSLLVTENAYPREALLEALLRFVEEHLETAVSN